MVPKRHTSDFFTISAKERLAAVELLDLLRRGIAEADGSVLGSSVGANCGAAAGQTVMHAHIHLIPRRRGDSTDPRGGVRGVIPGQMKY